jgi:histidine ammonia-lyase
VLAVELLTACQALDFRQPLKPGAGVLAAHRILRQRIPHADQDYEVRSDLEICANMLRQGELVAEIEGISGPLA